MTTTRVDISFTLADVNAKRDTTATVTEKQDFINLHDLSLEGVYAPPATTCERNYWRLDGKFEPFPDNPADTAWGLWSHNMTDKNGNLPSPIVLTLNFTGLHSSVGLSFEFNPYGDDYCNVLNIKWYRGENLLSESDFYPDHWRYSCMKKVENYNKVIITFYSMNRPFRYLKVQNIMHGMIKFFKEDEMQKANLFEEVDLSGTTLSINTLDFTVFSKDDLFNPLNPAGIYTLLQKKQQLIVEGTKDGNQFNLGMFYIEDMESEGNKLLSVRAIDGVGIMDGTTFKGGIYTEKPAHKLIEEIMEDAGFGFSLDNAFRNEPLTGYLPICSHREALQQVVFALGAYVSTARSGTVHINRLPVFSNTPGSIIGKSRKFVGTKVKVRPIVTGVTLVEHSYSLSAERSEVYKGELVVGRNEITFSNPSTDLRCNLGEIVESNVNYAVIETVEAGECTITGKKYEDNTKSITVGMEELPAGEKENIIEVDCTLISAYNSDKIAKHLFEYYQLRIEQNISFILDNETVGDLVGVETEYNTVKTAAVESMDTDLFGGFVSKVVVTGE